MVAKLVNLQAQMLRVQRERIDFYEGFINHLTYEYDSHPKDQDGKYWQGPCSCLDCRSNGTFFKHPDAP